MLPRALLPRRLLPLQLRPPLRALSSSGSGSSGQDPNVTGQQDTSRFKLVQHGKDDPPRLTCSSCGWIHYDNPKVVVGSVVTYQPKGADDEPLFLLCRRAIPPRRGYLNLPAGYMERGEGLAAAAAREAREEATAQIECGPILAIYDIPHIAQVHIYHLARLLNPDSVRPGYESLDAQLLPWSAIDFDSLAFPTVSWALMHYRMHREAAAAAAQQARRRGQQQGGQQQHVQDPALALWEPQQAPFRNPVLPGREGNTNVWYNPHKGGLVYDETWLRRRLEG